MLEEALVLDGHQSLPDMIGDVGKFNVRAVLGAVDLLQLLPLARALVLIIDDRALVERDGAHIHVQHRLERGVDIFHKNAEEHQRRADADGQERAEHLQRRHAGAAPSVVFSRRTGGFVFPFHCATSFCELKKRSSALLSFDNRQFIVIQNRADVKLALRLEMRYTISISNTDCWRRTPP